MVMLTGISHTKSQGHHVQKGGRRLGHSLRQKIVSQVEIKLVVPSLEGLTFEQGLITAPVMVGAPRCQEGSVAFDHPEQ